MAAATSATPGHDGALKRTPHANSSSELVHRVADVTEDARSYQFGRLLEAQERGVGSFRARPPGPAQQPEAEQQRDETDDQQHPRDDLMPGQRRGNQTGRFKTASARITSQAQKR